MTVGFNGHVIYTVEDFKGFTAEELDSDELYYYVTSAGLSICKNCGEFEAGLDNPCTKTGEEN